MTVPPAGLVPSVLVTVPATVTGPPGGAGLGVTVWVMVEVAGPTLMVVGGDVADPMELPGAGL